MSTYLDPNSMAPSLTLEVLDLGAVTFRYSERTQNRGGNFHLKVGGAKSSGNAGDPMLGVAVSGGSRIYKRGGGHKIK